MLAGDGVYPECIHLMSDQLTVQVPKPKAKAEKVEEESPEMSEQALEVAPEDAQESAASEDGEAEDAKDGARMELDLTSS